MTTLYLVRHGQTDNNIIDCFNGTRSDQPLNATGMEMAAALTTAFADVRLDAIYASPLVRAYQTAEGVRGVREMEIVTDPDLMEMPFGAWDGLTYKQAKARDPKLIKVWRRDFAHFRAPEEQERPGDVATRMFRSILRIVRAHRGGTVAIATHGLAMHLYMTRLLRCPIEQYKRFPGFYNAAWIKLEIEDDGHFCIQGWGKREHYKPEEVKPPRRKLVGRNLKKVLAVRHYHPALRVK